MSVTSLSLAPRLPQLPLSDALAAATSNDSQFAKKESAMKREKLAKYAGVCSEIVPKFLYVGGDAVASDAELLLSHGVTHIVNAAGCSVPEYHFGRFTYSTLHVLDDGLREEITSYVHSTIEFIEAAWNVGGRVLIHCSRGVSRSCILAIGYVMWRQQLKYQDAYAFVRLSRPICEPNAGFAAQMMAWGDRRAKTLQDSGGFVYRVQWANGFLVAKLVTEEDGHSAATPRFALLDPRFAFVVVKGRTCAVWVGKGAGEGPAEAALLTARRLATYDGCDVASRCAQGEETPELNRLLLPEEPPVAVDRVPAYDADHELHLAQCDCCGNDFCRKTSDDKERTAPAAPTAQAAPTAPPLPPSSRSRRRTRPVTDGSADVVEEEEGATTVEVACCSTSEPSAELYELRAADCLEEKRYWTRVVDYDHHDLDPESLCWLRTSGGDAAVFHFMWVGADFETAYFAESSRSVEAVTGFARKVERPRIEIEGASPSIIDGEEISVVWEKAETDHFWGSFELGY